MRARTAPAGAVIRDCHFHDAYDGVMQLRSPGAIVTGNLFERAHTMQVATAKSWLEGAAGLEGIAVTDNVFRACCTPKVKAAEAEAGAGVANRGGGEAAESRHPLWWDPAPEGHGEGVRGCDPISMVGCVNCTARNNSFLPPATSQHVVAQQ